MRFSFSEESFRDIIRNELRGLASGTTSPNEENPKRKVSISERTNNGKSKGKSRRNRSASHVEIDPQVAVKPGNAKGQPLPNGLTHLRSRQKTPEEKVSFS